MRNPSIPAGSIIILIFIFVVVVLLQVNSYKRGQIDCLNGVIKYHLVEQKDTTTKWERIHDKTSK